VLSGFVARDADRVEAAHVAQGLVAAGRLREGDWVAVMMRRPRPARRR
jgi:ribosomal protein L11 methylase PrmA